MSQNLVAQIAKAASGGVSLLNLDANGNLLVTIAQATPAEPATPLAASSGDVANAVAAAALAGAAGKTTYISGLSLTGMGATAAGEVTATVTGVVGGPLSIIVPVVAGATLGNNPININFTPPLAASAVNTAITVSMPALGAGNLHAAANAWGFRQ